MMELILIRYTYPCERVDWSFKTNVQVLIMSSQQLFINTAHKMYINSVKCKVDTKSFSLELRICFLLTVYQAFYINLI